MSAFINDNLVPLKSNCSKSSLYRDYATGSQFGVPQTIFTDATGEEIGRIVGYRAPEQFQQQMQSILADYVG